MQWLNYHHLYYFYVIATEGSVTRATEKLRLAQSTLSAQLNQFEDTIGYKLFERKNRSLKLTDVGRRVYEYAHEIFSLGNELRRSLGDFEKSLRDKIRIGVLDSVPKPIVQALFREVNRERDVRVTIREHSLTQMLDYLDQHEIDLILSNDKPPTEGGKARFHAKMVGEMPVVFVAAPEHFHLRQNMPRSLDGEPLLLPGRESPLHQELREHFKIKHVQPELIGEIDDIELIKMLVIEGRAIAALPTPLVAGELQSGELVSLSETPICHESLWLISGHRLVHNPVARHLLDHFRFKMK